jgi:hypothetical protein
MTRQEVTFDGACTLLDTALTGTTRQNIISAAVSHAKDFSHALQRLREGMRSNEWKAGAGRVSLERIVRTYDRHTRHDGFHVLNDWDGKADKVNLDTIPVDVLHFLIERRGVEPPDRQALAILLDYYFLHLLALLSLRVWDEGDADANLDRLDRLLRDLQGGEGCGQLFVRHAETLLLLATSHFELHERGFGRLLAKVRTLNRSHRITIARAHAASLGSHLRFGFEATYGRDTVATRDDNVADYPWLCFALATLMDEYVRMHDEGIDGPDRDAIVEAMLGGLSADARAFVGEPPASLSSCEAERSVFRAGFETHRAALLEEFARHRPSDDRYSPLSLFFNFSHNILKGTVVDALLRGDPWPVAFDDLLTADTCSAKALAERAVDPRSAKALAERLMGYARASPDTIRGRRMPVIVYDPRGGRRAFDITIGKLKD